MSSSLVSILLTDLPGEVLVVSTALMLWRKQTTQESVFNVTTSVWTELMDAAASARTLKCCLAVKSLKVCNSSPNLQERLQKRRGVD